MSKQTPKTAPQTFVNDDASPSAANANTSPAAEPAAQPAADALRVSAVGLPLDEFHGQGGEYVIKNGVRRLVA